MRFLTPILFFVAGGWVWWHNSTATTSVVSLPFMDLLTDDIHQQGAYSAYICFGIGGWLFLWDLVALLRKDRDRLGG